MPKAKERDGVFTRKDRPGWWVSFINAAGERKKQKVEAHTRTQALAFLAAIKTREEKNKILGVKLPSEISTGDLLSRYRRYQKSRVRSTTFRRLEEIIKTLTTHLPAMAKEISRQSVQEFMAARSAVVAPATVRREATVLKHVLNVAVQWNLLPDNVARGEKLPRIPEGRTKYLTPHEFRSFVDASPLWMKAPVSLAVYTGMRRGELLSLCWSDVDCQNRRLYLRETKNGTLRVLSLNNLAMAVIESLTPGRPGDHIFADVDAQHLTDCTRRIFAKLGIKDASFHTLRHTFASWLVMRGVSLYVVGQLLGHKSPQMTQRYAHLSPNYMANTVEHLDQLFVIADSDEPNIADLVPVASPPQPNGRTNLTLSL